MVDIFNRSARAAILSSSLSCLCVRVIFAHIVILPAEFLIGRSACLAPAITIPLVTILAPRPAIVQIFFFKSLLPIM